MTDSPPAYMLRTRQAGWAATRLILPLLLLLVVLAPTQGAACLGDDAAKEDDAAALREWTLIYYIAHDNDLGEDALHEPGTLRRSVLDLLGERSPSADVAAVAFADKPRWQRMRRIRITESGRAVEPFAATNSADPQVLAECLEWAVTHEPARRYAVVLLGHGGRLGELCVDANPHGNRDKPAAAQWMSLAEAGTVLGQWRNGVQDSGSEVELLFLQVCGGGTLAAMHELRAAARYLLASQTTVYAPNHFYAPLMRCVAETPEATGRRLASWIARHDKQEMFVNYATVATAALEKLPAQLDDALAPLLVLPPEEAGAEKVRVHAPDTGEALRRYTLPVPEGGGEPTRMVLRFAHDGVRRLTLDTPQRLTLVVTCAAGTHQHASASGRRASLEAHFAARTYRIHVSNNSGGAPRGQAATTQQVELHVHHGPRLRATHTGGNGEAAYDTLEWLRALYRANGLDLATLATFEQFISEDVVVEHHRSSVHGERAQAWCGLAITVPRTQRALERDHALALPQQGNLKRLFEHLLSDAKR